MSTPAPKLPLTFIFPKFHSHAQPTTADLVAFAAYMQALADNVDTHAPPTDANNPWYVLGMLQASSKMMHQWLGARLIEEERNLLLMDRFRAEEQQALAHEELMATDDDYADEVNGDDGEEE